jgi:hypothetical protein
MPRIDQGNWTPVHLENYFKSDPYQVIKIPLPGSPSRIFVSVVSVPVRITWLRAGWMTSAGNHQSQG